MPAINPQATPGTHSCVELLLKVMLLEVRCLEGWCVALKNSQASVYGIKQEPEGKSRTQIIFKNFKTFTGLTHRRSEGHRAYC